MNLLSPGNPAEYLAARYSGSLDTRALWEWAGGKPDEAVFDEDPVARWATLWKKAVSGETASDVALLREALFDRPGDEEGIAILDELCAARWERWKPSAELLLQLVGSLFPDLGHDSIWLSLQSFPGFEHLARKPADCAFALLAGRLQGLYAVSQRAALETMLEENRSIKPPQLAEFPHFAAEMLVGAARASFEDPGRAILTIQEGVSSMRSAAESAEPAAFISSAAASFESLKILPGAGADKTLQESVSASLRLLACMRSLSDGEPPPSRSEICDGFIQALWATTPAADAAKPAEGAEEL